MKISHSSLLADTGLSEIEIEKLGIHSIEREDFDAEMIYLIKHGLTNHRLLAGLSSTWRPFKNMPWYKDEDILSLKGELP